MGEAAQSPQTFETVAEDAFPRLAVADVAQLDGATSTSG
jgi:hypothetical protein